MRTYVYVPVCFIALLVVCLMFAPVRLVTGDRNVYSIAPTQSAAFAAPTAERSFADLCRDEQHRPSVVDGAR